MSFFTAKRERQIWLWTPAVVVVIFASLGFAGRLTEVLRDRGLLDASFVLGALLVLVTILTQGLRIRPGGAEIAVALGVTVAYFMVFVRMGIPGEERTHLIEYGVVAVLVHESLMERASQGHRVPVPALLAVVVTELLGGLDKGIKAILPSRVFGLRDIGFNALAGLLAITASAPLRWALRRGGYGGVSMHL